MAWTYKFKRPLPRPSQVEALKRALKRRRFGIFFEQRVGKSRVAADFCGIRHMTEGLTRVLIVCPKSVMSVWPEAIEQYLNLDDFQVHVYPDWPSAKPDKLEFFVINYDMVWRRAKEILKWDPPTVILDEVHRCKKHTRRRSKAVYKLTDRATDVLGLTGTPGTPENGWFGIMRAIDPSIFGTTMGAFEHDYLIVSRVNGYPEYLGYQDLPKLEKKFARASIRVLYKDVAKVVPTEDVIVPVTLEKSAAKVYRELDRESYLNLDGAEVTAGIVLTKDLRLHQLAGGFLTFDDGTITQVSTAKIKACAQLVEDLREDDKQVIIVCRFRPEIAALYGELVKHTECACITGGVSGPTRKIILDEFQGGHFDVLIAQEHTIAEGLDLTAAHNMILFSVDFSLNTYQQVKARVLGRAQKHPVTYWHLQAKGTVDREVYRALIDGEKVIDKLVNARRWRPDA